MVVTIVEAFVKLGLFMGYMILISRMKVYSENLYVSWC